MKYIKTFELGREQNSILYDKNNFTIAINSNGAFTFDNRMMAISAISAMAYLINNRPELLFSKYLNNQELRDVKVREIDIERKQTELKNGIDLYLMNIKKFHSSEINHFIENKFKFNNGIKEIPDNVYMNLVIKYHPIISNALTNCKTLGDIIDKFKVIIKDINEDLEFELKINPYNL